MPVIFEAASGSAGCREALASGTGIQPKAATVRRSVPGRRRRGAARRRPSAGAAEKHKKSAVAAAERPYETRAEDDTSRAGAAQE